MSDLRAPDSIEAQVRDVMNVNPADPASRQMARRVVEALGRGGVSEARSRMLDRQVLALAQADPGSAKTWSELQWLASKAHELDATLPAPRKGLLGRLLHPARRSPEQAQTTIEEMDAAVSALTSSAEVLRQNDVALDGYEADLVEELQRVEGDVQRAVLERGVRVTGATAYFADGDGGVGGIILQKAIDVLPGDDPESLGRRVMEECEWPLLTRAVAAYCGGELSVRGNRVKFQTPVSQ